VVKFWKVILATMVIFGTGVVTGAMIANLSVRPPIPTASTPVGPPPVAFSTMQRADFTRRLQRQVGLTREQHDEIDRILKDSNDRTKSLWEPIAPQMREEVKRVRERIRSVLTDDQRAIFDTESLKPKLPRMKSEEGPGDHKGRNAPGMQKGDGSSTNRPPFEKKKQRPANRQPTTQPSPGGTPTSSNLPPQASPEPAKQPSDL
jgi:hypothetical protein